MSNLPTLNSPTFHRAGILFVLSAPSGAGKTTLTSALRQKPDFVYAVSCTTRAPRSGEVDGEDYFFLDPDEFARRAAAGEFLESAEVHGCSYGTLKATVLENLTRGVDVLIDIDTTGANSIRSCTDPVITSALADADVTVWARDGRVRMSAHAYTTEDDAATALRVLDTIGAT